MVKFSLLPHHPQVKVQKAGSLPVNPIPLDLASTSPFVTICLRRLREMIWIFSPLNDTSGISNQKLCSTWLPPNTLQSEGSWSKMDLSLAFPCLFSHMAHHLHKETNLDFCRWCTSSRAQKVSFLGECFPEIANPVTPPLLYGKQSTCFT